uniref:Uncharacterized protein n=1 Tax=Octopus bimaculoides TaxID=37653 RepID=A0A0L8FSA3_OCTBM
MWIAFVCLGSDISKIRKDALNLCVINFDAKLFHIQLLCGLYGSLFIFFFSIDFFFCFVFKFQ